MSNDIPSLETLAELTDRVLECAHAELAPERTTLEVTAYADGDYEVRAFETVAVRTDPDRVFERTEVRYNRGKEWIELRRCREWGGGMRVEEVRDLEPYTDPVSVSGDGCGVAE